MMKDQDLNKAQTCCAHLSNEREIIWLDLFDIDPDFALAVKIIFTAGRFVSGKTCLVLDKNQNKYKLRACKTRT